MRRFMDWYLAFWRSVVSPCGQVIDKVKLPCGPKKQFEAQKLHHLSPENIRWGNLDHQRAAAAVLVEAVYVLPHNEKEAQKYWDFLGFERLAEFDMTEGKNMIIGAVFRHKRPTPAGAPEYVIAFRGTHNLYDVVNDLYIIEGIFKYSPRMMQLKDKFANFFKQVPDAKTSNLWLTGHSLGSTIAMLLVVEMLRGDPNFLRGGNIMMMRTLLFNPPCPAVVEDDSMITQLRQTANRFADVMLEIMGLQLLDENDRRLMSDWKPELYVNEEDIICKSYIDYFEKERYKTVKRVPLPGGKSTTILLPSAELVKYTRKPKTKQNMSLKEKLVFVHELNQWWEPNLDLHPKHYLQPPSRAPSFNQ